MAQDVHIKLSLLVPKICDAKNQDTYYNAFIDGSTQWWHFPSQEAAHTPR